MEKRVASSQLLMTSDLKSIRSGLECMDSKLDELTVKMEDVLHKLNRIAPHPSSSPVSHVKPLSTTEDRKAEDVKIMEKKLLPKEDKQELRQRFYALKQGKRVVAEYIVEFDDMRKKCGFREACENTIAWFIRGLSRKIAKEVELKKHETLDGVYKYALKVEKERALAKMSSSKPCTTMEQSAKEGISVAKMESPKPNVPPPPPPSTSHDMPLPPPKHELPPPPKCDLPPPLSSPTTKPQPRIEEDSGLSIEVSKDVVVCGEKGRDKEDGERLFRVEVEKGSYKEDVVERVVSVEVVNVGIVVNMPKAMERSSPLELFEWLSGKRSEIVIFKNYMLLRWENLTRVKMKERKEF